MAASTALSWTSLLVLGAASTALFVKNRNLERRLDEVALQGAGAAVARTAAGPSAGGPTLAGSPADQAEVAALKRQVEALVERVEGQERRLVAPGAAGTAPSGDAAAFERGVRDVLDRVQQEPEFRQKVAEAAGKPAIEKKPTFAVLAQHLALDSSQEATFRHDLEDVQGSLMALLAEQRPDGRVLLEEIGKADQLPEGDPQRAAVFLDLFKLRIPGTEQTYVERALELAMGFRKKAETYLRPEQRERFAAVDVDLFGVKMN